MLASELEFLYLGKEHYHPRKCLEATIWFKNEVNENNKNEIEALIPYPLSLNMRWGKYFLHCSTDDIFSYRVREVYGSLLRKIGAVWSNYRAIANESELQKFYTILDENLKKISQKEPILFFYKMKNFEEDGTKDERLNKEELNLLNDKIIPALIKSISKNNHDSEHTAWLANAIFDYIPYDLETKFASSLLELMEKTLPYSSNKLGHEEIIQKLEARYKNLQKIKSFQ